MKLADYRKIAPLVNADLEAAFKKHGLKMGKLKCGIDELDGTLRYTITCADTNLKDAKGNATTPEAARYRQYAEVYGMKVEWLDQTFRIGREEYVVVGLRDSARAAKSVIVRRVADNSLRITTVEAVVGAFTLISGSRARAADRLNATGN